MLIILISIISAYALLPQILSSLITTALQNAGLDVDQLTVTEVAADRIEIPHARLTNAAGTAFDLNGLSANYSLSQLLSGKAESISVQQLGIQLTDKKSDLIETLSGLQHLLGNDLTQVVPLTSATIHTLLVHDSHGKSLLQAQATLSSDKKTLQADLDMHLQNGENGKLNIVQQQPGQWTLQADDTEGNTLIDGSFQQARRFPLHIELNASLQQLRPWLLLSGYSLPGYQAATQASIKLKPDYAQKTFQFELDASLQDTHGPEITLQSATTTMVGEAAIREDGGIDLSTSSDVVIDIVKSSKLSAESLKFGFDAALLLTKERIHGHFLPELNIEAHNLTLLNTRIETAALQTVNKQDISWELDSGNVLFGNNTVQIKKADARIGNRVTVSKGDFQLEYDGWSYPLQGSTRFNLSGTAENIQQDSLQLTNNTVETSGNINWPTAQEPAAVAADLAFAAKQIQRKSLFVENAVLTGKTLMTFNQDAIQTSLVESSHLIANKATLGSTQMQSPRISLLRPFKMQWSRQDKAGDFAPNQLTLSHQGSASKPVTVKPGTFVFSVDNWNSIKQPKLTGAFSSDSTEIVVTGKQQIELNKTEATYAVNWPVFTLKGKSTVQLSNSRMHFDLVHDVVTGRGSASYRSDAQEIDSAASALKKAIPRWPAALGPLQGSTSVSGKAKWQKTDIAATATLTLNNISGNYSGTAFTGLDSSIDLDLLPTVTGKSRTFRLKSIAFGAASQPAIASGFNDWDDVITPELVEFVLGNNSNTAPGRQVLVLNNTDARLSFDWPRFTLSGQAVLERSNSQMQIDLSHDVKSGSGSATYRSDAQHIATVTSALKKITPDWPSELQLVSGATSFSGKANWRNTDLSVDATLNLNNIGGNFGEAYFSGLNSSIDLNLLPTFKGQSRSFLVQLIDIGVPVSQFSTTLDIKRAAGQKKPVITLRNTSARMLNGSVSGNRIELDLNRSSNNFTLAFKGVDLAELIKLHQFEGLNAIGKLSGTIPIRLEPDGIFIADGKASADSPGGSISYIPTDGGETLKNAQLETELVLNVLRNFQYNQLDATGQYKPDGQLQLKLEIKGKSPEYDKNRPVHLNLNLDQNILSLIKSIRAINGLHERLDKAVQEYYESRQR